MDITTRTTAQLETMADGYIKRASTSMTSLAEVFSQLYVRSAWDDHDVTPREYWRDMRGISPDQFVLARDARKRLIELTPDATLADHMLMSGASMPTVTRDKRALGIQDTSKGRPQGTTETSPDETETSPDETTDETPERPQLAVVPDQPAQSGQTPESPEVAAHAADVRKAQLAEVIRFMAALTDAEVLQVMFASGHANLVNLAALVPAQ